ncbi:MAG: anthranilate synthase component II [Lachnospiraceae bacterium]
MNLLIDNYDSFSYNLYQLIGAYDSNITVIRNNEKTISEIEAMNPDRIILSPGPGRPDQAGICLEVVNYFKGKIPILGICLGHQSICQAFGATITYAKKLMHGKQSEVEIDITCPIFASLPDKILAARYHSLAADPKTIPETLQVIAKTTDGEVMAVKHRDYEIYGLQFHPESILTPDGNIMLKNFLEH